MALLCERISSNQSYRENFRRMRARAEQPLDFNTNEKLPYNSPITILELKHMLHACKKSAAGEDKITYNMIRKSHESSLAFLLEIMNKIFTTGSYPSKWLSSVVLSFPKPGKPSTLEENHRPISLTSCVGKLMEKIVNSRLTTVLEYSKKFPPYQFGFRRMHGTVDALN